APQDRQGRADHDDRHDRLPAGGGRPRAAYRDQSTDQEDPDAESRPLGDVAGVAGRSLAGDEPPDENTGSDQNGDGNDEPREEESAPEKKGPGHAQEDEHASDDEPAVPAGGRPGLG